MLKVQLVLLLIIKYRLKQLFDTEYYNGIHQINQYLVDSVVNLFCQHLSTE